MVKILVVDDEPDTREIIKRVLETEGYEVMLANDGVECFDFLKLETPDVILLDIMMPGENGWEVCVKIKADEKTKDVPVAMYSVLSVEDSMKPDFGHLGADAYIQKTFVKQELVSTIENLLENAPEDVKVSVWA